LLFLKSFMSFMSFWSFSATRQLAPGGRLVIPIGTDSRLQELVRVRRTGPDFRRETLCAVRFVPLVGEQGWRTKEGEAKAATAAR